MSHTAHPLDELLLAHLRAFLPDADEPTLAQLRHFADNPTGDFTLFPMLGLIKARRLLGMMERTERRFGAAAGLDIQDLWKPYFCIATNYSRATELVLDRGPLVPAVMATCAIPGAMPPVLRDGDLLCDGGVFNNLPVDVMRNTWGIGHVIGVDLGLSLPRRIDLDVLPTPWQLARDRLRPKRQRRYRLPTLPNYLMNVTALYGTARQRAAAAEADLVMSPELPGIGMLQWKRYAEAVQVGYDETQRALAAAGGWLRRGP